MNQEQPQPESCPTTLTVGGAELGPVLERQKRGELRVHEMRRGKTNGEWILQISYTEQKQQ